MKLFLFVFALVGWSLALFSLPVHSETSNCQYPNRSTNTEYACDNSDPCDPLDAAKGGSGACKEEIKPTVVEPTLPVIKKAPYCTQWSE